jgi:prepilin-type N-terminal cleavage/methylation domain-containing protein
MYRIEETFIIYSKKKALTLIEMVIVIIIIGILVSAIIPIVNGIQARVRDTARSAYMRDLSSALEVFQMDTRSYPIIST